MSHWSFWEWVGYAIIFIGAAILALDQAFKIAPNVKRRLPKFFSSGRWGFAPLTLLVVSTAIFVAREYGYLKPDKTEINITPLQASIAADEQWKSRALTRIVGRQFYNQEVFLDGKEFINCEFDHVTFVYSGNAPFRIGNSKFGQLNFKTDSPSILLAWSLLIGIGATPNVKVLGPLKDLIQKPTIMPPNSPPKKD